MNRMMNGLKKALRELFLLPTHLYRVAISPFFPPSCIYTPSCSAYMVQSVREHGILKGSLMGIARILRCQHWFFQGGPDPVPHVFSWKEIKTGYIIYRKHHGLHRFKHKSTHNHDSPEHNGPHASQSHRDLRNLQPPQPPQTPQEIQETQNPTPPTNG